MNNYLAKVAVIVTATLLAGCASAPVSTLPATPIQTTAPYAVGFDQTWAAIIAEFAAEYPLEVVQKDSGLIQSKLLGWAEGFSTRPTLRKYAIEPRTLLGTWDGSRVKTIWVVARDGEQRTKVTIKCSFQGFENNVSKSWYTWESNGRLETELHEKLGKTLGVAK